ncbi:MAG: PhoH family protein [Clostridia bacterium]|nr:PhoH family protein [Clostridia bacterium]
MYEITVNADRLEDVLDVFGSFDANIKLIEQSYGVRIINRDTELKISGEDALAVSKAEKVLTGLFSLSAKGEPISPQNVRYCISLVDDGAEERITALAGDVICVSAKGKPIKGKTIGQKKYVEAIRNNTVTIGVGPAGTGKTYLAVACAVAAFREKTVNRIILTRPAVEAGEKLGFLPGDLMNKVDPYLRPLYDALFDMMGPENYHKYLEKGNIEVAPLAYMRGRTLDDSFIILDEAQNTTPEQMKMFLTRLGFGSKIVVNGDITQIDLPSGKKSGLSEAMHILKDVEGIATMKLTSQDVVRHELVQRIINAYDKYETKKKAENAVASEQKKFFRRTDR